jgi:hypothetical protein
MHGPPIASLIYLQITHSCSFIDGSWVIKTQQEADLLLLEDRLRTSVNAPQPVVQVGIGENHTIDWRDYETNSMTTDGDASSKLSR